MVTILTPMDETTETIELIERLARLVTNEGHSHGLKPAQWEALRYLARANRFSRTPGALTAYLGATKGTVSQTLMSLERIGLIGKTASPADRRSVRLDLTPAGRAMLARDELEKIRAALAALPQAARAQLQAGLRALVKARLTAGGGRPFGVCGQCRHFSAESPVGTGHFCRLLQERLSGEDAASICREYEAA